MRKMTPLLIFLMLTAIFVNQQFKSFALVQAQTEEVHQYYFPLFATDPGYAQFSSIGPDGGTVTSVEIDPANSNIVYAGSWGNGVFKSLDGGATWMQKSTGFRAGFVFDLAIDPHNSQHLLASAYEFGAYESFNGGESWSPTSGLPDETVVYSLKFDPGNPKVVYAAVRVKTIYTPEPHYPGGIYKSTNGGSSWTKKSSGLPDDYVYDIAIDPNNSNVLYTAMHRTGVYKSTNAGGSWFSVNNNIHYQDVRSLDINPDNSHIYAGMYDGKGVTYSTNGGASWTEISASVTQRIYVYSLKLDTYDQKTLYLTGPTGLYRCVGSPYPSASSGCERIAHPNNYVFDMALDLASAASAGKITRIYTGLQDFGVHKSTNAGVSFTPSYAGLKANVIYSVLNDPVTPSILYASAHRTGVFKSLDSGQTWFPIVNGLSNRNVNQLVFRPGNSNVIYAATQNAGIFVSDDAGLSWTPSNGGLSLSGITTDDIGQQVDDSGFSSSRAFSWMDPIDIEEMRLLDEDQIDVNVTASYPEILTVGIDPANVSQMIAGTAGHGILKSDDFGMNWTPTNLSSGTIYDSFVDAAQPTYTYFTGVRDSGIRISDANRLAWPTRNSGMHSGADVYGLTMAAPSTYYAGSDRGIYKTNNAGLSWFSSGLSGILFNDVFADPARPGVIWAASSAGLYRSPDGGGNWYKLGRENLNDRFLTIAHGHGSYPVYFGMSGGNIVRIEP